MAVILQAAREGMLIFIIFLLLLLAPELQVLSYHINFAGACRPTVRIQRFQYQYVKDNLIASYESFLAEQPAIKRRYEIEIRYNFKLSYVLCFGFDSALKTQPKAILII